MARKYTTIQKVALGGSAVCAVFIVVLFVAFGGSEAQRRAENNASAPARDCTDTAMAYIMSRRFVERELQAPGSAKFPSYHDDGVSASQAGDCKFRVVGFVDAQNSFGAMLRTRYTIDMEYFPSSKNWRGSNLKM